MTAHLPSQDMSPTSVLSFRGGGVSLFSRTTMTDGSPAGTGHGSGRLSVGVDGPRLCCAGTPFPLAGPMQSFPCLSVGGWDNTMPFGIRLNRFPQRNQLEGGQYCCFRTEERKQLRAVRHNGDLPFCESAAFTGLLNTHFAHLRLHRVVT